jgi:hypothetical protein
VQKAAAGPGPQGAIEALSSKCPAAIYSSNEVASGTFRKLVNEQGAEQINCKLFEKFEKHGLDHGAVAAIWQAGKRSLLSSRCGPATFSRLAWTCASAKVIRL